MRVHQEDFCQALGVHPERKYQTDGGPSVDDIARLLREGTNGNADVQVLALARLVAFNWLVLGTDAHATPLASKAEVAHIQDTISTWASRCARLLGC